MLHFQGKQALVCVVDQAVVWGYFREPVGDKPGERII